MQLPRVNPCTWCACTGHTTPPTLADLCTLVACAIYTGTPLLRCERPPPYTPHQRPPLRVNAPRYVGAVPADIPADPRLHIRGRFLNTSGSPALCRCAPLCMPHYASITHAYMERCPGSRVRRNSTPTWNPDSPNWRRHIDPWGGEMPAERGETSSDAHVVL